MLVLTVYILTFTVGFPANVFTFVTLLAKTHRRVSPADILLLNLTAADLLLLLFLPFKMAEAAAGMTWPFPAVFCPLANFCFYSSIYLSSLFLAALSVERYLGVVFPHHYKDWRRPGRATAASVVLWLLACSHCSVVFVAQYHGGGGHLKVNGSEPTTSEVRGLQGGGFKMADGGGFEGDGLEGFNGGAFQISNVVEKVFKMSPSKRSAGNGVICRGATTTTIFSGLGGPKTSNPGGPKPSNPGGPNPSNPGGPNPSNHGGPNPSNLGGPKPFNFGGPNPSNLGGPKTFSPNGPNPSNLGGPNPSNPGGPKPSNPGGPNPSNPGGPKPSNPTISITTSEVQEISSPFQSTTPTHGSSAPDVHHASNATEAYKCYHDFSEDQLSFVLPLRLELFLVLFLLPFAVTVFCYVNFVRALLARPNIPLEKKQRAVGLAVATMVNFGVSFAPYNISHVVGFVERRSPDWRVYALLLTSLNAALDPLIFYFSSTAVRRAVAGVGAAAGDKLRGAVGWCSSRSPGNESQGSLT